MYIIYYVSHIKHVCTLDQTFIFEIYLLWNINYCLLLREQFPCSVVWRGIVPGETTIICLVHTISFFCAEVNSSAFTLPILAMLSAKDKQTTAPSILRKVNLAKI